MKVIVVDSNALAYRSKYSMRGLSHEQQETGVIFGFMVEILRLAKMFETTRFVFCWDSKKSYRKEDYPKYKYKRHDKSKKTSEEIYMDQVAFLQFDMLRKYVLPMFGFRNVFLKSGYEGDDLIANIVLNNKGEFIIVSNDEDLYQLLDHAPIYSLKHKKLFTKDDFVKEYTITPREWIDVKSIAGCHTDNVEGIKGIGEKTVIKYLKDQTKDSINQRIENHREMIKRNRKLVKLPYRLEGEPMDKITPTFKNEKFSMSRFHNLCDEFSFQSFKRSTTLWVKTFNMEE